jgi:hypothetical protein
MRQKLRSHLTYANVMVTVLAFIVLGGTTYAATGGNFILGQSNSASSTTALSSGTTGPALKLTNTSTATGARALGLNVASGHPPFNVNSGTKVANLNADKLDGKDSTAFLGSTAKAADSDKLDGIDSSRLAGARAYAYSGGSLCGPPVSFCDVQRSKEVAYVVAIEQGHYCVGVNGISQQDSNPPAIALVSTFSADDTWAEWVGNSGCAPPEFEVRTGTFPGGDALNSRQFTFVIP